MFRKMRRKERQLQPEVVEKLLQTNNVCVMSVSGDEGYPYGVPVNYGYVNGKFYLHGTSGDSHKLDAIYRNEKVCLTIIAKQELHAQEFAIDFSSVIVFGKARVISDKNERIQAMCHMMKGIAPEMVEKAKLHCSTTEESYVMFEVVPDAITGKVGR